MVQTLTRHEEEILFSDFPDKIKSYNRKIVEKYSKDIRGSVRLATGRYYTQEEMDNRAKEAFSVKF